MLCHAPPKGARGEKMSIRIFTIPFDPDNEIFPDEAISQFLLTKRLSKLQAEFFQTNGKAYWTVFIEYETILGEERKADTEGLDEAQRLLMKRLRQWRKDTAEKEGVPVFIVATNKQLADVIRIAPATPKSLREINGFGGKKVERYGNELIEIVKAFYEKKPLHDKPPKPASAPEIVSGATDMQQQSLKSEGLI